MKITDVFHYKEEPCIITGESLWDDNLVHHVGDILECSNKKWKVIAVSRIFQGCFGKPKHRIHSLKIEPIDHQSYPEINDIVNIIR